MTDDNSDHNGPSLLCTGSQGPAWLATTGLPLELPMAGSAPIATCRVEGHPYLFASGDCAVISASPRPASGVWAVRAGRPLAINLEAACKGSPCGPGIPSARRCSSSAVIGCRLGRVGAAGDWGHPACFGT